MIKYENQGETKIGFAMQYLMDSYICIINIRSDNNGVPEFNKRTLLLAQNERNDSPPASVLIHICSAV